MENSTTLLSAHIQFLDTQLALIHIPLSLYSNFLQPILQLLLPREGPSSASTTNGLARRSWAYDYPFTNISVTPIECSISCSRQLAQKLFVPIRDRLDPPYRDQVSITLEDYVVMQVEGEGLDAGQRVLELTSPLAMAGISIFFITTYFSDYILVPIRARGQVVKALEDRGFAFEQTTSSYVNPANSHTRNYTSPSYSDLPPPGTPPPATVSELQTRTFALLKRRNIVFAVDRAIRLVQCAGSKDPSPRPRSGGSNGTGRGCIGSREDTLHMGLVKCLIGVPQPQFFSLTLTDAEPASLLLEKRLLSNFADDVLLGSKEDILIPITLDLRDLPLESTGIVCGVAGRLVGGTTSAFDDAVEMSYLSTARAGTVMVAEAELKRALEALHGAENGVELD